MAPRQTVRIVCSCRASQILRGSRSFAATHCVPAHCVDCLRIRLVRHLLKDGASFCYCAYVLRVSGFFCPLIQQYFCAVCSYVEKEDLSKGYQNPKRKLGATRHFSQIIELKIGKKLPYILCILALFWNYGSLTNSKKMRGYRIFLFGFQYPCQDLLFPHSHNLCKNASVFGGTILNVISAKFCSY